MDFNAEINRLMKEELEVRRNGENTTEMRQQLVELQVAFGCRILAWAVEDHSQMFNVIGDLQFTEYWADGDRSIHLAYADNVLVGCTTGTYLDQQIVPVYMAEDWDARRIIVELDGHSAEIECLANPAPAHVIDYAKFFESPELDLIDVHYDWLVRRLMVIQKQAEGSTYVNPMTLPNIQSK